MNTSEKAPPGFDRSDRARGWLCWLAVVPGLAWAAVRLTGLKRGPLVQAVAFTPYVAAWSAVPLLLAPALRRRWPAAVAALVAVALIGTVSPRTRRPNWTGWARPTCCPAGSSTRRWAPPARASTPASRSPGPAQTWARSRP
ncbi:hypothetical protein ACH4OY_01075 [Micromonospora rubida]|uniref:EamA domain-containing protein n=1 Tax=Micromonospora rubida TaxID=2697657 RepID=A0ABW7SC62_9ACTN